MCGPGVGRAFQGRGRASGPGAAQRRRLTAYQPDRKLRERITNALAARISPGPRCLSARHYRTIQIQAGPHTFTAADPIPDDLRHALAAISSPAAAH